MNDIFNPVGESRISTRQSYLKLKPPFRKTNVGQGCLSYIGPSAWNKLPGTIKNSDTINTFKHKVKTHYLSEREIGENRF